MIRKALALGCLLPAALAIGCAGPREPAPVGEWRQFRGPGGQGISEEAGLPVRWGENSGNVRWRAAVPGAGNSSPVVSGGKVFLTTAYGSPEDDWPGALRRKEFSRVVLAYDLATGEKLWETVVFYGQRGRRHFSNTFATPTPATDGRRVFVSFDAHLAALDFEGNLLWDREIDPDYYEYALYGVSSSPVLTHDAVILLQDKEQGEYEKPGWIAAFDKDDGEQIWRHEWDQTCCSYNTPLVVERLGRQEVWNATAGVVLGYDARTGEQLWRGEHPTMQTVPSMVRQGDLFVSPGGIHWEEIVMFHLCETEDAVEPIAVWSSNEGVPEISSPVLYNGRLFTITQGGALYVWDPRTGKRLWRKRLPAGEYRPSMVAGDGKVYVDNGRGTVTVIDAAREKPRILARNTVAATASSASPAIADRSLILRGGNSLVRIDPQPPPPAGSPSEPAAPAAAEEET